MLTPVTFTVPAPTAEILCDQNNNKITIIEETN